MINKLKYISLIGVALSCNAFGHANIAPENAVILGDEARQYKEGSSPRLSMSIGHDCTHENGQHFNTMGVVAILPNSEALPPSDFYTSTRDGEKHFANAFMSTKARYTTNWRRIDVVKGPVVPFYSHGLKEKDARALKWLNSPSGGFNNDLYEDLEFKTKLPKFKEHSCYTKLRVEVPVLQYCRGNTLSAWIGTAGSRFITAPHQRVTTDYTPYFEVVRDMEMNPLPAKCGDGEEMTIRPSDADIDLFGHQFNNPNSAQLEQNAPMIPEMDPGGTHNHPMQEEPAAEQPAADQPAAEQPAAEQPAAEQPAAEQPAAEQPAAEQLAAEQLAAEQPAAEQPMAEMPMPDALGNCPEGYEFWHDMSDHTNKCRLMGS